MDVRWSYFGVTSSYLEAKASWLKEARNLHGKSARFFELAGKLVLLSRDDYELASLAFFQAVIGLERALRLHFESEDTPFSQLFMKAVEDGTVSDVLFSDVKPLSRTFLRQLKDKPATHSHKLSLLIPILRNQFMHGTYLLSEEYLPMTFQLREIADALQTNRV